MASLPSQAPRRRSSPIEQSSTPAPATEAGTTKNDTKLDERSTSFVLNDPQAATSSAPQEAQASSEPPKQEPRTCWICQQVESEDTPQTSEWRSPCPCSLQAHEECLLEWITNEEAPRSGDLSVPHQIDCPQCKAPIQIDRPKDYLVFAADKIQRAAKAMILPTAVSTVVGCFYSGLMIYGINTMQLVFGREAASRIMAPTSEDIRSLQMMHQRWHSRALMRLIRTMDPFLPAADTLANWKLFVGLPLIAPALVLSRTKLADHVFAIVPVTYFMFRPENRDLRHWPPSPALTVAVLPYIRSAYNEVYKHTFSGLEKQWDAAVQRKPREGETAEQIAQQANEADGEAIFDLEVEFIQEEDGEEMPQDQNGGQGNPAPIPAFAENQQEANPHPEPVNQPEQAGDAQIPAQPDQNRPPAQQRQAWEVRQNVSTAKLATTVMGALFFPAISSIMGDLLKYTLPTKWVTKSATRRGVRITGGASGMLQEKWGRSIIGGCLFVVLKDVVILYCKWKRARDFGKRRVVDYVRPKGRSR